MTDKLEAFVEDMSQAGVSLDKLIVAAEQAERYEDMCFFVKKLIKDQEKPKLNNEQRNLLSVAYKFVIGRSRSALRCFQTQFDASDDQFKSMHEEYKRQIEGELVQVCEEALGLLEDLRKTCDEDAGSDENKAETGHESQIFYLKMTADYYRYLAESVPEKQYTEGTEKFYKKAYDLACEHMGSTHPIRLGLALNYSVCFYEILEQRKEACTLAKNSFDQAISELDNLPEAQYKDSTLIMQLLRDNLTLWTSSDEGQDGDDADEAA